MDLNTNPKVTAATIGAGSAAVVATFLIYLLDVLFYGGYESGPEVPLPVSGFVALVVAIALTFAAGYQTSSRGWTPED